MKKYMLMSFGLVFLYANVAMATDYDNLRMTQEDVHVAGPGVTSLISPVQPQDIEPAAGGDDNLRMTEEDLHTPPASMYAPQKTAAFSPQDIEPAAGGNDDDNLRMTFDDIHHMGGQ